MVSTMTLITVLAFLVLLVAMLLVARGVDVRLVLFAAGLALATLAARPWVVFDAFLRTVGDGKIVGPICSAMGFAWVLRVSGSDRELARFLIRPIRRVKWLLVPGGCAAGFITNMAITSQTASAAAVGPILVPIMLAAGWHPILVAATLVLGCSAGGNLYNPGEADIVTVQSATGAPLVLVLERVFAPELAGFATAVVAFTILCRRTPRETVEVPLALDPDLERRIQVGKALLPMLPIALLLILQPRFALVPALLARYPEGLPVSHAMLFSTLVAMLVHRHEVGAQTRAFFEGMGFGFVHVISLIITASCLIAGMEAVGLVAALVGLVSGADFSAKLFSGLIPWALAVLSGSGTAPSVAFSKAVLPALSAVDLDAAIDVGLLGAIGATFGRTMSPVAAVVIFTSTLVGCTPLQIVKRTGPALAIGFIPVLGVMLLRGP
jgi:DcuC family C4-dicarboxylate transporter